MITAENLSYSLSTIHGVGPLSDEEFQSFLSVLRGKSDRLFLSAWESSSIPYYIGATVPGICLSFYSDEAQGDLACRSLESRGLDVHRLSTSYTSDEVLHLAKEFEDYTVKIAFLPVKLLEDAGNLGRLREAAQGSGFNLIVVHDLLIESAPKGLDVHLEQLRAAFGGEAGARLAKVVTQDVGSPDQAFTADPTANVEAALKASPLTEEEQNAFNEPFPRPPAPRMPDPIKSKYADGEKTVIMQGPPSFHEDLANLEDLEEPAVNDESLELDFPDLDLSGGDDPQPAGGGDQNLLSDIDEVLSSDQGGGDDGDLEIDLSDILDMDDEPTEPEPDPLDQFINAPPPAEEPTEVHLKTKPMKPLSSAEVDSLDLDDLLGIDDAEEAPAAPSGGGGSDDLELSFDDPGSSGGGGEDLVDFGGVLDGDPVLEQAPSGGDDDLDLSDLLGEAGSSDGDSGGDELDLQALLASAKPVAKPAAKAAAKAPPPADTDGDDDLASLLAQATREMDSKPAPRAAAKGAPAAAAKAAPKAAPKAPEPVDDDGLDLSDILGDMGLGDAPDVSSGPTEDDALELEGLLDGDSGGGDSDVMDDLASLLDDAPPAPPKKPAAAAAAKAAPAKPAAKPAPKAPEPVDDDSFDLGDILGDGGDDASSSGDMDLGSLLDDPAPSGGGDDDLDLGSLLDDDTGPAPAAASSDDGEMSLEMLLDDDGGGSTGSQSEESLDLGFMLEDSTESSAPVATSDDSDDLSMLLDDDIAAAMPVASDDAGGDGSLDLDMILEEDTGSAPVEEVESLDLDMILEEDPSSAAPVEVADDAMDLGFLDEDPIPAAPAAPEDESLDLGMVLGDDFTEAPAPVEVAADEGFDLDMILPEEEAPASVPPEIEELEALPMEDDFVELGDVAPVAVETPVDDFDLSLVLGDEGLDVPEVVEESVAVHAAEETPIGFATPLEELEEPGELEESVMDAGDLESLESELDSVLGIPPAASPPAPAKKALPPLEMEDLLPDPGVGEISPELLEPGTAEPEPAAAEDEGAITFLDEEVHTPAPTPPNHEVHDPRHRPHASRQNAIPIGDALDFDDEGAEDPDEADHFHEDAHADELEEDLAGSRDDDHFSDPGLEISLEIASLAVSGKLRLPDVAEPIYDASQIVPADDEVARPGDSIEWVEAPAARQEAAPAPRGKSASFEPLPPGYEMPSMPPASRAVPPPSRGGSRRVVSHEDWRQGIQSVNVSLGGLRSLLPRLPGEPEPPAPAPVPPPVEVRSPHRDEDRDRHLCAAASPEQKSHCGSPQPGSSHEDPSALPDPDELFIERLQQKLARKDGRFGVEVDEGAGAAAGSASDVPPAVEALSGLVKEFQEEDARAEGPADAGGSPLPRGLFDDDEIVEETSVTKSDEGAIEEEDGVDFLDDPGALAGPPAPPAAVDSGVSFDETGSLPHGETASEDEDPISQLGLELDSALDEVLQEHIGSDDDLPDSDDGLGEGRENLIEELAEEAIRFPGDEPPAQDDRIILDDAPPPSEEDASRSKVTQVLREVLDGIDQDSRGGFHMREEPIAPAFGAHEPREVRSAHVDEDPISFESVVATPRQERPKIDVTEIDFLDDDDDDLPPRREESRLLSLPPEDANIDQTLDRTLDDILRQETKEPAPSTLSLTELDELDEMPRPVTVVPVPDVPAVTAPPIHVPSVPAPPAPRADRVGLDRLRELFDLPHEGHVYLYELRGGYDEAARYLEERWEDPDSSVEQFLRMLPTIEKTCPGEPRVVFAHGVLCYLGARRVEGLASLQKALGLLEDRGDEEGQEVVLKRLNGSFPEDVGIAEKLAAIHQARGRRDLAASVFRRLGESYIARQQPQMGRPFLERALDLDQTDRETALELSRYYRAAGSEDRALDVISKVLRHHPSDRLLELHKAISLSRSGRGRAGETLMAKLLEGAANDPIALEQMRSELVEAGESGFLVEVDRRLKSLRDFDLPLRAVESAPVRELPREQPTPPPARRDEAPAASSRPVAPVEIDDSGDEDFYRRIRDRFPNCDSDLKGLESQEKEVTSLRDRGTLEDRQVARLLKKFKDLGDRIKDSSPEEARFCYERGKEYVPWFEDFMQRCLWADDLDSRLRPGR